MTTLNQYRLKGMKSFILAVAFLLPLNLLASRQPSHESAKGGTRSFQPNSSFTAVNQSGAKNYRTNIINPFLLNPGSAADLKDTFVNGRDIDFESGSGLNWPPLPRAWLEYSSTNYVSSNTYLGFKAAPSIFMMESSVASKLSFDFRYQVKTSFVAIVSKRSNSPQETNQTQLFVYDDKHMRTFLRTSDSPMVGICIYEVLFAYDKGASLSFDLMGSGQSLNSGNIQTITHTHFSSFFQIESKSLPQDPSIKISRLSVDQYKEACEQHFKEIIEPQVNADFSKQIMQFVFHNHPKSQCKPTFGEVHPDGDPSCQKWFQEKIPPTIQKLTVPRCTLQPGGAHVCSLFAKKEGVSCPVFMDENRNMSDKITSPNFKKISTRNIHFPNFPCDEQLGLSCQITKEPTFFGNVLLTNAEARCAKK